MRASDLEANLDRVLAGLSNIAMKEEISRFAGAGNAARNIDTFEAEVSIADGAEQYTNVRGHNRTYHHVSEINGLWTFGELVTMLHITREIVGNPGAITLQRTADRTVIRFRAGAADCLWYLSVAGRIVWLDLEGALRIDAETGEIESLTWSSEAGPAGSGIASVFWEVNFREASVAGDVDTMPSDSVFRVVRTGRKRDAEWNLTRYSALGRFGSTTNVSYGE